ncbi:MAG: redoxin family protein [Blastomonas sp.]
MRRWTIWLPFALFGLFFVVAAAGLLWPGDTNITSKMVGKELPAFDLPPSVPDRPGLARADFNSGKPVLLNIFASWCVPCIAEAPQLEALSRMGVTIHGVAIRDRPDDVARFLAQNGNPYTRIGADDRSAIQFEIGSSGVPESFIIDGKGRIVHQHIGEILEGDIPGLLLKLKEAEGK